LYRSGDIAIKADKKFSLYIYIPANSPDLSWGSMIIATNLIVNGTTYSLGNSGLATNVTVRNRATQVISFSFFAVTLSRSGVDILGSCFLKSIDSSVFSFVTVLLGITSSGTVLTKSSNNLADSGVIPFLCFLSSST
jgi:hypothetical protein